MNTYEEINEAGRRYLEKKLNPARWIFSGLKYDLNAVLQQYSEAIRVLNNDTSLLFRSFFDVVPIMVSSSELDDLPADKRYDTSNFIGLAKPPQRGRIEEYVNLFCRFYDRAYRNACQQYTKIELSDPQTFPQCIDSDKSHAALIVISSADVYWIRISAELTAHDTARSMIIPSVGISYKDDIAVSAPGRLYYFMRYGLNDLANVGANSIGQLISQFLSENPEPDGMHDPLQLLDALANKFK